MTDKSIQVQFIQFKYQKAMSQKQLVKNNQAQELVQEQEEIEKPILDIYEAIPVDQIRNEEKAKKIYNIMDYPLCQSYTEPDLTPIKQKKNSIGKEFALGKDRAEGHQIMVNDGIFQHNQTNKQSSEFILRQKLRMVRDLRQEFFEENGEYLIQKDFFQDQLSKLANISYQDNIAIKTFQKNAILSERNNQKKQTPFQLQLNIGGLWFNKHPQNNQEEQKFEQIRPLMKDLAQISAYPVLPQIDRERNYLKTLREYLERNREVASIVQIDKKIEVANQNYEKQTKKVQQLMRKIVIGWNQIKQIRKKTGIQTVPYKLHVKEYQVQKKVNYDIGLIPFEPIEKVVGRMIPEAEAEQKRREKIREQKYFIKIYINDNFVGKSQKFNLQWPHFRVPIIQKFNIMVYSAPNSIKIEVIKSGIINTVVDIVSLAIPGIHAKTITSSQKRFAGVTFASNSSQMKKDKEAKSQAPAGILLYRIEWVGDGNKMPPISIKSMEEETACTEDGEIQDLKYQELFDYEDPRVPHKTVRQKVEAEITKKSVALLPFADTQSARILLLKLKSSSPEVQKIPIPLSEDEIRHREDLLNIIENQKEKNYFHTFQIALMDYFHPLRDIFQKQDEPIKQDIGEVLKKIKELSNISNRGTTSNVRYKITEEIINQYTFQQMESPIVIFFKNFFTQKRKLGPVSVNKFQARTKIDELEINLHIRSATNLPIRQASYERIKKFQDQQMKQMAPPQYNMYDNNRLASLNQYGNSLYGQQPQIGLGGNTFLNYRGAQVNYNYQHTALERINGFVEMRFKKYFKSTHSFQGPFPEWNETLAFNYNMKSEATTLEKICMGAQKLIKVYVYDMIEETKPTQALAEARVKKSKLYLGRIDIPFSTIVAMPSISGIFKIDRPLILFSYGIKKTGLFSMEQDLEEEKKTQNPDIHTYINLDLFTEPIIDNLVAYNSDRKFIPGVGESPLVLQKASDWLEELNTKRYLRLWLNNLDGKSVFICRYLSNDVCPPKLGQEDGETIIQRCARFVSLIPKKFNCKLMENTEEFHLKADQFLNVKMGEDHGILLCNYFNFIDRERGRRQLESHLIIGKAFPYGKCIFVLRRNKTTLNCQIWDPFRGQCYYFPAKQYETFCFCIKYERKAQYSQSNKDICPLTEVSCIVSIDNVYFNLQDTVKPSLVDFNIEDDKLWRPFITERVKSQLFEKGVIQSIQPKIQPVFYTPVVAQPRLASQLEKDLYLFIREKIEIERKNHVTPYTFKPNTKITNLIANKLLPYCELFKNDFRTSGADSQFYSPSHRNRFGQAVRELQEEHDRIISELPVGKRLFGFPLNMTYTTKYQVYERVAETQIHLDQNDDLEFVLSVRCFEHPCYLFSVWVFIGSIG